MTVGQALVTADREHSQEMQQQFAEAKGEPRDIEVQAVLDGTSPADAGAEDAGAGDGSGEGAAATAAATDSSPCPSPGKAGGGLAGRPPLERGSLFGGTETRSVGSASETEEGVQLTQPQGEPWPALAGMAAAPVGPASVCEQLCRLRVSHSLGWCMRRLIKRYVVNPTALAPFLLPQPRLSQTANTLHPQTTSPCAASSPAPLPSPRKTLTPCCSTRASTTVGRPRRLLHAGIASAAA